MKNVAEAELVTVNDSSKIILNRHLNSFLDNDLKAVMSDYTNESVLVTPDKTYTGLAEIKTFMAGLMIHFPKHACNFDLDKTVILDGLAYIIWHATTPSLNVSIGTNTFIFQAGKIFRQTFAAQMKFIN